MTDLNIDQKREVYLERIKDLTLMDDVFLAKVLEDKACAQLLVDIILNRKDLTVQSVHSHFDVKEYKEHPMPISIEATDENGKLHHIKIVMPHKN